MRAFFLVTLILIATTLPLRAADPLKGRIVYSRKSGDRFQLHVMNADGSGDRELPGQANAVHLYPTWSPDGKRIACMGSNEPGTEAFQILLVNADGSGTQPLPTPNRLNWPPAWSPDGKLLAFSSADQVLPVVHVAEPGGAGFRAVAMPGMMTISPFWKRDGSRIGFTRLAQDLSKSEIVLVKPDGSDAETLVQETCISAPVRTASHRTASAWRTWRSTTPTAPPVSASGNWRTRRRAVSARRCASTLLRATRPSRSPPGRRTGGGWWSRCRRSRVGALPHQPGRQGEGPPDP